MSENVQKQVNWFLKAKNLIKFIDSEVTYKLSDPLLQAVNSSTEPILKGDKVEVGIKDGIVVYLSKVKKDVPKVEEPKAKVEEPKVTPTPAPTPEVKKEAVISSDVKELTVFAVAANKKVVKFTEIKDDGWFTIDPSIQAKDYAVIGLQAKNKAKVQIVEKNVISFEKVAGEAPVNATEQPKTGTSSTDNAKSEPTPVKAAEAPKKEWKPQFQGKDDYWAEKAKLDKEHYDVKDSEKQKSIEIQSAINSASQAAGLVAAAITNVLGVTKNEEGKDVTNAPTANTISNMINAIAKNNYQLLQELKSK